MTLSGGVEVQQLARLQVECDQFIAEVGTFYVTDAVTFTQAADYMKTCDDRIERIKAIFDPICDAAYRAHKEATGRRALFLEPLQRARMWLRDRMGAWEQRERDRQREAERLARLEAERLEAEARERAEAEQRRLRIEAEDRLMERAAELANKGDREAAERVMLESPLVPIVIPPPILVPPPPVSAVPVTPGLTSRETWDFSIENPDQIPRAYMVVNETAIRKVVAALGPKAQAQIPGIRVFRKTTMVRKGR